MLTQPSTKRFLEAIQHTLRTDIAPAVSSRDATVSLQAIDAILGSLIRRVESETNWMREEISEIEEAAEAVINQGADPDGNIARDLTAFRAQRAGDSLVELQADYERASALLSQCLERALIAGGALRQRLDAVLQQRLNTESFICGSYKTVGKD